MTDAEPPEIDGTITTLEDAKSSVSLVEYDGSLDAHEPVTVDIEQFDDFIQRCKEMGWDATRLYVMDNQVVLGRAAGDDGDLFVGLAPVIVDGNQEVDLDE